jgi:hypothetical protein
MLRKWAGAIHEALGLTKTPRPDSGAATPSSEPLGIDQKAIEDILGRRRRNSAVCRAAGRDDHGKWYDRASSSGGSNRH